jgi:hypothetical protein
MFNMIVIAEETPEIPSKTRTHQPGNGYKCWQKLPNRDENPRQEIQETVISPGGKSRRIWGVGNGRTRLGWIGVGWDVFGRGRGGFRTREGWRERNKIYSEI